MNALNSIESNIATARAALAAVNRGDLAGVAATVTADWTRTDLGQAFNMDRPGADPLVEFISTVRTAMPDFTMKIVDTVATTDRVVAQIRLTGTHLGEFMGMPATGRYVEINGVSLYRFRDGLICHTDQLLDMAGLFRQLKAPSAVAAAK